MATVSPSHLHFYLDRPSTSGFGGAAAPNLTTGAAVGVKTAAAGRMATPLGASAGTANSAQALASQRALGTYRWQKSVAAAQSGVPEGAQLKQPTLGTSAPVTFTGGSQINPNSYYGTGQPHFQQSVHHPNQVLPPVLSNAPVLSTELHKEWPKPGS